MGIDYKVNQLYEETITAITASGEKWRQFCELTGRIYRYEFINILMVYAQRPNATLVADYNTWESPNVGRHVRWGSKGIAIFPSRVLKPGITHVFDVADTGGRDARFIWELNEGNMEAYAAYISQNTEFYAQNGGYQKHYDSAKSFLHAFTGDQIGVIMKEDFDDEIISLSNLTGTKRIKVDDKTQEITTEEALYDSILYAVFTRCGFEVPPENQNFSYITAFAAEEEVYRLGSLVSDISCQVLREIAKGLKQAERSIAYDQTGITVSRGNRRDALSQPDPAGGRRSHPAESGQVRNQGDGILKGERKPPLPNSVSDRETGGEDGGSGRRSQQDDGYSDSRLSESESARRPRFYDGNVESQRTGQEDGRGDRSYGNRIEIPLENRSGGVHSEIITEDSEEQDRREQELAENISRELRELQQLGTHSAGLDYPEMNHNQNSKGSYVQASLFDMESGPVKKSLPESDIGSDPPQKYTPLKPIQELVIPHRYIKDMLLRGSGYEDGKQRIYAQFQNISDIDERIKVLKKEYGQGGANWPIDGYGLHGYDTLNAKGIRLLWRDEEGEIEGYLNWKAAEREISILVLTGEYDTSFQQTQVKAEISESDHAVVSMGEAIKPDHAMGSNYRMDGSHTLKGSPKTRYQWNVEAIRQLKKIEAENRPATSKEQQTLTRYVGWGGLSQVFDAQNNSWEKEYKELKSLLLAPEYNSARDSVNTAFYTSPVITEAIYTALKNFGFRKGSIQEPALGIGNFFGSIPDDLQDCKLYGIEKDPLSGRIAKLLYPKASIKIQGYEESEYPDNFFDVSVGNVPFGDYKLYDPRYEKHNFRIHDYFFAKAIDQLRPGGILAFVTSKGTMDKANPSIRRYLAERAELIGAIRLPNTAFRDSAGTDVTADIVFLQKRERKTVTEAEWIYTGQTADGIPVNSYFAEHPEMMLGTMEYDSHMFGIESKYTSCINRDEHFDLKEALAQAIANMTARIVWVDELLSVGEKAEDVIEANPDVRNFTYAFVEGRLYYRENSRMYHKKFSIDQEKRIRYMDEIRGLTRQLISLQTEGCSQEKLKSGQALLNTRYDAFLEEYGPLSHQSNSRAFRDDADYPLLRSLEVIDEEGRVKKADMFYKQTIRAQNQADRVETAVEAMNLSINEYGTVNISFMLSIYQPAITAVKDQNMDAMSEWIFVSTEREEAQLQRSALIRELTGLIFLDPSEYNENNLNVGWKTADEYLSGNVRNKLRIAAYAAENEELFGKNVEALQAVQPKDLEASEIEVRIGTTWIEPEDYESFIYQLLNTSRYARKSEFYGGGIEVKLNPIGQNWYVANKSRDNKSIAATKTYGTSRMDAYAIFEETLNLRTVTVRDRVEEEDKVRYVVNKKETMLAREKQNQIKQAFRNWIFSEPERRAKYVRYYNETFNNIRLREFDGSYLKFPGMNPEIRLRPHQKNAVARILSGGNTLLAHVVGAGKTYTMMAACMEQKRLGLINKNVMVVPKPLIGQTAGEFLRLYPSANILVATERDFEKSRRKQFVARIATGDYDSIIMSHSQFEKISISKERREKMLEDQILDLANAISELKIMNGERWTVKQAEAQKKKLESQLKSLADESRKDDMINFEDLGIDSIMVDEAHHFKNLAIFSKINSVSGISSSGAKKATDMQLKTQYLNEINGNRGIVFATGTPISNTMCEMYVMQQYLQRQTMEQMGINHFDAWAANFGEVTTALELNVEGSGFRFKSRFNRFVNLPELTGIFREVADVQTADMLKLPVPALRDGGYKIISSEPDWYVKNIMEDFVKRAEAIRTGQVPTYVDNFLKITHEARLLGTDARLLYPDAPDNPDSKLNHVAEHVAEEYFTGNQDGAIGCQLVFSDIGTPGGKEFDVYHYLKEELIKRGIPETEIAFIHDAKSDVARDALFKEMRTGKKKILIGSTDKCGTGVNVQTHLTAIHHVDCPWKPSSIEQREGRGIRQGNENKTVAVYRYVTEGTFDAYSWNIVENKQRFISQIMTGRTVSRTCEDIDETVFSYAEIKAIATGNPLIKEKMQLDNEVQRLNLLKTSYDSQRYSQQDSFMIQFPRLIRAAEEKLDCVVEDKKNSEISLMAEPAFTITVGRGKYTERTDGGAAMLQETTQCKVGQTTPIGYFKGFELLAEKNMIGVNYMVLRGKTDYKAAMSHSAVGNMVKLENLFNGIGENIKFLNGKIEQYRQEMEQARADYEKPFTHADELREKKARLDELNVLLSLENGKEMDLDLGDDEPMIAGQEHRYTKRLHR